MPAAVLWHCVHFLMRGSEIAYSRSIPCGILRPPTHEHVNEQDRDIFRNRERHDPPDRQTGDGPPATAESRSSAGPSPHAMFQHRLPELIHDPDEAVRRVVAYRIPEEGLLAMRNDPDRDVRWTIRTGPCGTRLPCVHRPRCFHNYAKTKTPRCAVLPKNGWPGAREETRSTEHFRMY